MMNDMSEDWLREKYLVEQWTGDQIAKAAGCKLYWVYKALRKFGIPTRPIGPQKGTKFGPIYAPEPVTGAAEEYVFPLETDEQAAMWRELLSRSHAAGEVA